jgi:hypothetical protein
MRLLLLILILLAIYMVFAMSLVCTSLPRYELTGVSQDGGFVTSCGMEKK